MTALTVATFPSREGLTIPERPLKLLQVVLLISDRFRHARSAVACPVLPLGVAVEIDAVVAYFD